MAFYLSLFVIIWPKKLPPDLLMVKLTDDENSKWEHIPSKEEGGTAVWKLSGANNPYNDKGIIWIIHLNNRDYQSEKEKSME